MKKLRTKKRKNNTILKLISIVFFGAFLISILLFLWWGKEISKNISLFIEEKTNKVIYDFFTNLITDEVINEKNINNILNVVKDKEGNILAVNYDLEKTYAILTEVSVILKESIANLENGQIDVKTYDKYLESSPYGLILNVPIFLNSSNVFLNNLGPKIPVKINISENLLTNVKTKVTDYGFNNALLEVYITVEMDKLIITPLNKEIPKLHYDILVSSLVVNGKVPEFYGNSLETFSNILYLPMAI